MGMGENGRWLAFDCLGAEGCFGTFCVPKKYRSQWNGRKGHPNRTGLAARSPSAVKRELQKLIPCGCSDMMRPAEVPLGCNSFPFHGSLLAQFCNGVNSIGADLDPIFEL